MSNKVKLIIIAVLFVLISILAILTLKNIVADKVVAKITERLKEKDENLEFTYQDVKVDGLLSPKGASFTEVVIKSQNYKLDSKLLLIELLSDIETKITFENVMIDMGEAMPDNGGYSYRISFPDRVVSEIKTNEGVENTVILPKVFNFFTNSGKYLVEFNNQETPIMIDYDKNKKLKILKYYDDGLKIYNGDISDNNPTSTSRNIINIERSDTEAAHIYDINISSTDNKIIGKDLGENDLFSVIFNAQYESSLVNEKFEKHLKLNNFALSLPHFSVEMNGSVNQDWRNFVPFGNLNVNFKEYKKFIEFMLEALSSSEEERQIIIDKFAAEPVELESRFVEFVEKIGNIYEENLNFSITRTAADLPLVNNLTLDEIDKIYAEIFKAEQEESN